MRTCLEYAFNRVSYTFFKNGINFHIVLYRLFHVNVHVQKWLLFCMYLDVNTIEVDGIVLWKKCIRLGH